MPDSSTKTCVFLILFWLAQQKDRDNGSLYKQVEEKTRDYSRH